MELPHQQLMRMPGSGPTPAIVRPRGPQLPVYSGQLVGAIGSNQVQAQELIHSQPQRSAGVPVAPKNQDARQAHASTSSNLAATPSGFDIKSCTTVVFEDHAEAFPYHAAVFESRGQMNEFTNLVDVLVGDDVDPLAAMDMQLPSVTTSEETLCAAEYAYSLGYRAVGDYLVARMGDTKSKDDLAQITNTTPAQSVELSEDEQGFAYVEIVNQSHGDVDYCESMCEVIEDDGDPIDARIRAKVKRERRVDVRWTAFEYTAHLGYVDIVKSMLRKQSRSLPQSTKIYLMKMVMDQAKEIEAQVTTSE